MTAAAPVPVSDPVPPDKQRLQESDLTASTAAEFMAMLRRILHSSKMTAGQVSALTKLPRSTTYRFVDPNNTTLPARPEQVERFVRACGLRDDQVVRVMRTWHQLKGTAEPADDADQDTVVVPEVEVFQRDPEIDEENFQFVRRRPVRTDRTRTRNETLETSSYNDLQSVIGELWSWSEADRKRSRKNGAQAPNIIVLNNPPGPSRPIGQRAPVRSWAFRRQVLGLLAMVLQPLILREIFGPPQQTILLHVLTFALAVVALALLPQLGRPSVVPSSARLAIAAAVGGTAAGLAWWATAWPVLALMSGLLVFMAVPMWLAVMDKLWAGLFTSSRGIFAVVLAAWFGVLTGVFLATTHGFVAGAALGGALTAAGVLMETAARIMPTPNCPHCQAAGGSQKT